MTFESSSLRDGTQGGPTPRRRVALATGGTAGHVMIALAIAEAYERAFPGVELLFLGNSQGLEAGWVQQRGYRFEHVPSAPYKRQGLVGKARALVSAVTGTLAARRQLRENGVRLVVGAGSFASIGPLIAARSLGLGRVVHEANIIPGLANRLLGRIADRVFLGFEETAVQFPGRPCRVTGTPVRAEVLEAASIPRDSPGSNRPKRILITAGSEGSTHLDQHMPALSRHLVKRGSSLEVRHQVGHGDLEAVRRAYADAGVQATAERFFDDLIDQYFWADCVFAAAGAATLAELAVFGLPAVLVPVRTVAEDHQRVNVQALERLAGVRWADERDWQPQRIAEWVGRWLGDREAWKQASERMRRLARPEAGQAVVEESESLMSGRW